MSKVYSGSAVPRHFVFILADGSFVVQWDEASVQDLLTGRYRAFDREQFGHPITDYELNQLKAAGRVEHYNRYYVWLYALPERNRFAHQTQEQTRSRLRAYYLTTPVGYQHQGRVEEALQALALNGECSLDRRGDVVVVLGKHGKPFLHYDEAENLQKQLIARAPDIFRNTVVAFTEISQNDAAGEAAVEHDIEPQDLATILASQTDTTVTEGRRVGLAGRVPEEQMAIRDLCWEMRLQVWMAATAGEALQMLEDQRPDLLIMDLQMPDMHGWEMLGKIREITDLENLPIIMLAEAESAANLQSFALAVARVSVFLVKPVSMARLRQNIWMALKGHYQP